MSHGVVNVDAYARDLSEAVGIPPDLIPSVVHRVKVAERAVTRLDGFRPLGEGAKTLVRRVVARSALDHDAGVLERRVAE